MACIVYRTDSAGRTYAYSSESFWDKEKHQPRSKRTYLGRVDPVTGEILKGRQPRGSSKERLDQHLEEAGDVRVQELHSELEAKNAEITRLKEENEALKKRVMELSSIYREVSSLLSRANV